MCGMTQFRLFSYVYAMSKSVRLDEDVYARIEAHERDDETFSDAVARLVGPVPLRELGGVFEDDAVDAIEAAIEESDRRSGQDVDELVEAFDGLRNDA